MSQITEILNLTESWVQQCKSDELVYINLLPGLTSEQIEAEVARLPYRLPREITELYRWHNGDGQGAFLPFPNYWYPSQVFYSLSEAVSAALHWNDRIFPNMNVFPLFQVEEFKY